MHFLRLQKKINSLENFVPYKLMKILYLKLNMDMLIHNISQHSYTYLYIICRYYKNKDDDIYK